MNKTTKLETRRSMIVGTALAIGGFATRAAFGRPQQSMAQIPSTATNAKRTSLHQEIEFKAGAVRIYEILLDSKQFATFTRLSADIDPKAGGAFKMFGGLIEGRNVELIRDQRIVQAWRPTHWDPGVYSIVKFELKPQGAGAKLVLDHTGFPEGEFDHLDPGWHERYWEPLQKFLG